MQSIAVSPIEFDPFTPATYQGAPRIRVTAVTNRSGGTLMKSALIIKRVIAEMVAGIYQGQLVFITDRNMTIGSCELDGMRKHHDERNMEHVVFFGRIIAPKQRNAKRIGYSPINLDIGDTFIADYQVPQQLAS